MNYEITKTIIKSLKSFGSLASQTQMSQTLESTS